MRNRPREDAIRQVQTLFQVGTVAGLTDGELLDRFLNREGEVAELAFSLLIERHGPMVLSVCRRILRDPHAAQDAFQATFLVLVRKARAIRCRGSVASWLYGVAHRVSATARAAAFRRKTFRLDETHLALGEASEDDSERGELSNALHDELARLPERYRAVLVLCYLEGLTHEQAALRLDRPLATVRSWLVRGREQLRVRLTRRGVTLSVGAVATALARNARSAVSPALVERTTIAATAFLRTRSLSAGLVSAASAAMTEGVLRTMFMTKLKLAVLTLSTVSFAALSAGGYAYQDPTEKSAEHQLPYTKENVPIQYGKGADIQKVAARPATEVQASAAADEYIARTSKEVDASIAALRAEVKDLTARLERAKASLRRMEALKAALNAPAGDAVEPVERRALFRYPAADTKKEDPRGYELRGDRPKTELDDTAKRP